MPIDPNDPQQVCTNIRRRPAMYVGGTDVNGMTQLVWELVANSVDQFLAGHATGVRVVTSGNHVEVSDDGIGLPFDVAEVNSGNLASSYLQRLHVTASADGHAPHVHCGGLHGIGLVAVNVLSSTLHCEAWRNGQLWCQDFQRGVPAGAAHVTQTGDGRGTRIVMCPDSEIFGETSFDELRMRKHLFEIAHLHPGLRAEFNDEVFRSKHGLADYVAIQEPPCRLYGLIDRPVFCTAERIGDISVNAAAVGQAEETVWKTWVNGVETISGSHVNGFMNALQDAGWRPAVAAIHVVMHDPRFAGPTREKLDAPKAAAEIRTGLGPRLSEFCRTHRLGKYSAK